MVEHPTSRARGTALPESSVLRAHARWILAVTLVAVAIACLLSWALHTPVYRSEARVLVNPGATPGGAPLPPDMETERQVVVSGAVTSEASQGTDTSSTGLQKRLTVTVPADSTVLVIDYSDRTAADAQQRAQAIADAYIAYRAPQAALLDAASSPRSATGPNYLLNAAAALVVGLLIGVGSALLRDHLDDRVRGPRDLVDGADVPILATVPGSTARRGEGAGAMAVLEAPDSPAAEAYRRLRGKVTRAADGGGRTTRTMVTSAAEDDGAAQVAANTAAALALAGGNVLLVEADLRNPRLAGLFGVPAGGGLGGVLARDGSVTEALRDTGVERLRLLPAGADLPAAPGELLDEEAVEKLLGELPAGVDHVVVLAPPVLSAAETCTIAPHAHLLLLAVTRGRTRRRDFGSAVTELVDARAPLLGAVLCDHPGRPRRGKRSPQDRDVAASDGAAAAAGQDDAGPGRGGRRESDTPREDREQVAQPG